MANTTRLSNKVAIVTVASNGIGAGIATAFGAAGARVSPLRNTEEEGLALPTMNFASKN